MSLRHLAGRVWWYPHDPDLGAVCPLVGIVAGERGSVVVDAGNSPLVAHGVRAAMTAAGLPAPRWLVYTHHHWDHTWGACAWGDVEIVGHESAVSLLRVEAERPWSHRYLRDEVSANPRLGPSFRARALAVPDWNGFRVVPPRRTFGTALTLPDGVELRHVGGRHAEDSVIVVDPASGVVFLGDCYFPPPLHLRRDDDTRDHAMVDSLLAGGHDWYVDSHSDPWTRAGFAELAEELSQARPD